MTTPQAADRELIEAGKPCDHCGGEGWTVGTDYETQCCGGSDWECGARGCTGPIQEPVAVQKQCEACLGTGSRLAHSGPVVGEGIDAG